MKVPIRTLSQRDVDIMARSTFFATVSKGYVEHHDLRWGSPSLTEWMLRQKNLRRPRKVEVLIDELDLSEVFVLLPAEEDRPPIKLRTLSTQPQYTKNLSLFEHEKLKAAIKAKHLNSRLVRMEDGELLRLRTEYYALLGRQGDPISARRLEKLKDQLAERRLSGATSVAVVEVTPPAVLEKTSKVPPPATQEECPPPTPDVSPPAPPKRRRRKPAPVQPPVDPEPVPPAVPSRVVPEPEITHDKAPGHPPKDIATPAPASPRSPIYNCTRIKRKHR